MLRNAWFVASERYNRGSRNTSTAADTAVKLPKRQKPQGYREPDYPYKRVPEKF
jgi:hypothetical protein